jgi:hypothetical protein
MHGRKKRKSTFLDNNFMRGTLKWPGHNVYHSPSFTAEVKMVELYLHSPT